MLLIWVVERFDEVQNTAPFLGAPKDLVNIIFLALFDIVGLSENLRGVRRCSVFAGLVGLKQRYVEEVVNPPFPRKRESNGKGRDDLFHLEGPVIPGVQLPGGSARFDVAPVQHHQVSNLVFRGLGALGICVVAHSFVCCFQLFGG